MTLTNILAPLLLAATLLPAAAAPVAVRQAEGIAEYRLGNGLQVLLIPDASKPTVTVNVTYRVGSRHENYGETGMAHLLEHLMFKTTKLYPNVSVELARRGMQFNGSTTPDRTNYFETFPADPASLNWALRTEADRMTGAKVLRKDLDTEMTVVRNEMEAGENSPVGILIQRVQAAAYQWHAYGRSTIGARSDVESVDIARLQAFYRKYYQPDNATLIVAGAFDAQRTLAEIDAQFGRLPRPARKLDDTYTQEPVQEGERLVTLRRSGGQQALFASYHMPALASPDFAAFEIAVTALTDTPAGRLHQRLVEAGKATQVFGWAARNAEPGLLNLGAVLKKDDALDEAQRLFVDTLDAIATEPLTEAELQRTQRQWSKDWDRVMADPQSLCVALSEAIAAGDWRLLFQLRDRVQALTLPAAQATLAAWMLPSNRTLGRFIASDAVPRSPLAARPDVAAELKSYTPTAALAAGESFDPTPANIDQRTERYTLPSGLRVALMPKRSRGQTVELNLNLHFGTEQSLRGQRVTAYMTGELLGAGTATKTRAQIRDAFDALKTDFHVGASVLQGGGASLSTRRDTLVPALTLLAEVLRRPSFPATEFDQAVRQAIAAQEQALQDPEGLASMNLSHALAVGYDADDPRYFLAPAEQIAALKALKRESLAEFHRRFLNAGHGELAVVGDFDAAALKAAIAQLFGDWTSAEPYARVSQPMSQAAAQRLTAELHDKPNAVALGSLPLALNDDHPDYAALRIAAHVLGASGFDSRLVLRLRQKDGLSYGAGANLQASSFEPSARLGLYAIFAPENRAKVEQGFTEELQRFVRDGLNAAELDSAKKAMRAASATFRADDSAVAWAWTGHLERGRSFAWNGALDARGEALTLAEVNAAIRKWIDPTRIVWSLAGDFGKAR